MPVIRTHAAFIRITVLVFVTLVLASNGLAQDSRPNSYQLFSYPDPEAAMQKMTATRTERALIEINPLLSEADILREGDLLQFEIKGVNRTYRIERVSAYFENTRSIRAVDRDAPQDNLLLTLEDGIVTGILHAGDHTELYQFRADRNDGAYILELPASTLSDYECSVAPELHTTSRFTPGQSLQKSVNTPEKGPHAPHMEVLASTLEDRITIDIMVVYTEAAKNWANSQGDMTINSAIAFAMNLAQSIFDNSETEVTLRLVHTHETDYDETSGNPDMTDHLYRFTASPDYNPFGSGYNGYMDEVHALRVEYGADLMILLPDVPGQGGVGFVLNQTGGFSQLAFSVSNIRAAAISTTVFSHEIGHNLGGAHARDQQENPADELGGIFEYSTGYRFQSGNESFSTIMAYAEGEYLPIPQFSSPDLRRQGIQIGTYSRNPGPSDNARTFRQTKRIVSGYYDPTVEPPEAVIHEPMLAINMDQEDLEQIPIVINNQGDSDLIYEIDFSSGSLPGKFKATSTGSGGSAARASALSMSPLPIPQNEPPPAFSNGMAESAAELYKTTFSADEGFEAGTFSGLREWRTFTTDQTFQISSDNPATGSSHLRITDHPADTSAVYIRSPYFGIQPFGAYEFSADIFIAGDERFDLYLSDSRAQNEFEDMTAGAIFTDGIMFSRGLNENGNPDFTALTSHTYPSEQYFQFRVVTDPTREEIRYYLNGNLRSTRSYTSGTTFGSFLMIHGNSGEGGRIDIDNVSVKRLHSPFTWLSPEKYGGVVEPGESDQLLLDFLTAGVDSGTYEGVLIIRTNDSQNSRREIPITLTVSGEVASSEEIFLEQNYPNPFSPSESGTTIEFSIPTESRVRVELYSISGRRVRTLFYDQLTAGTHRIPIQADGLASGVYIYQVQTDSHAESKKMILIN
ncbi:MAG: zinc-dependent metalloprotease [Balneolaceae bacterium]